MAGKSTISITFKIDGDNKGFKDLVKDADGFKKVISETISEAQKLNKRAINFAALATGIDSLQSSVNQLYGALKDLTDAYAIQETAEKQLETVMRQRMAATDAEIQSIKELASAQQGLGVVGDEVQLSGAQQIATFLKEKASLEVLIPAMNDLLAQQKGLNATNQDAVTVANLMGKALMGQASALRRVGITFDEEQEKVIKYGTESERAAMLAQIITDNVGHMNAELAKTDSGKQKQLENTLGDIKEQLGGMVKGAMPFITIAAQSTTALSGVTKLFLGVKSLTMVLGVYNLKGKAASAVAALLGFNTKSAAISIHVFGTALQVSARAATVFKIAMRSLLIATGIGAAYVALTAIIEYFVNTVDNAAESLDSLKEAEEAYITTTSGVQNEIAGEVKKLSNLIQANKDTTLSVAELNEKYGSSFGIYKTAGEWYEILTKKSKIYAKQVGYEAKARVLSTKIAERQIALEMNAVKRKELEGSGKATKKELRTYTHVGSSGIPQITSRMEVVETPEMKKAKKEAVELDKEITVLNSQLELTHKNLADTIAEMTSGLKGANEKIEISSMNWEQVSKAISETEKKLKNTTDPKSIKNLKSYNAQLKERKAILDKTLGLGMLPKPDDSSPAIDDSNLKLPEKLQTLKDYNDALAYWKNLQETASKEEYANIQKTIDALNKERDAFMGVKSAQNEEVKDYKPAAIDKLNTIKELNDAIAYYSASQEKQNITEAQGTQRTINALEAKKKTMLSLLDIPALQLQTESLDLPDAELKIQLQLIGLTEVRQKITELRELMKTAPDGQKKEIENLINKWEGYKDILTKNVDKSDAMQEGLRALGSTMSSIGNTVKGNTQQWMQWSANVLQSVAQAIPAITSLTSAQRTAATANTAAAATGAASSVASIPFVGPILAIAAVASVLASLISIPKFAKGGIAYGPTLGLFGEYSGASNNPEVVAPLDRLRSMLQPVDGGGKVEFEIKGRTLVGVLNKEINLTKRS